jgi:hypothetical protein
MIRINSHEENDQLALVIGIQPMENREWDVNVEIHPSSEPYLPTGLKIYLLNGDGDIVADDQITEKQKYFKFKISVIEAGRFGIRIC